jgi:pimeloyl-ACP methyl ester carboxylesterase/class 3 adenylate cyclase
MDLTKGQSARGTVQPPETRYTKLGDVSIAYQVFGHGPDLIMVPLFASHLDLMWTDPGIDQSLRHLASYSRVILFDMPGTGLSDRVTRVPTLDERVAVIGEVLDAAGSERATVFGSSEGGQASMLYAATYPERTTALILYSTYPNFPSEHETAEMLAEIGADTTPENQKRLLRRAEEIERMVDEIADHWGEGRSLDLVAAPPHSPLERRFWAIFERAAMSRSTAREAMRAVRQFDVRMILPTISVPTLVLHPTQDLLVPVELGRYMGSKIPNAKFVETAGRHHGFGFGDWATVHAEIERFLTGESHGWDPNRAFAALLFTDIVGSTERAAELGDQRWRDLLERHDSAVRDCVEAFNGRVVKQLGDGFLIRFDSSADAIQSALAVCASGDELGIRIRAGVHSGECELVRNDLAGIAVHIGARIAALAQPGEVLVSKTVADLVVESGLKFADRGLHRLKGVPDEWQLLAVLPGDQPDRGQLTASPSDHLTRSDRFALGFARRVPGILRATARLVRSRQRSRQRVGLAE